MIIPNERLKLIVDAADGKTKITLEEARIMLLEVLEGYSHVIEQVNALGERLKQSINTATATLQEKDLCETISYTNRIIRQEILPITHHYGRKK